MAHELTPCKMRSPLKTLLPLLQHLSSSHTLVSCASMSLCTYMQGQIICISVPCLLVHSHACATCVTGCVHVLVKCWSCSVFSTPHCDAEAPDWAVTHHGLSARSLRSGTEEYRQTEEQEDIPRGVVRLTSVQTWPWNPSPGHSHSTKITSEKISWLNRKKGMHNTQKGLKRRWE